jgi:hypothetical protein
MHLTINGQPVSYSLEGERSLAEVVEGVRAWLAAAGFLVAELSADGQDLLKAPTEAWGARTPDSVGTLAVTATRTADMRISHWQTVDTWLGLLDQAVADCAVPLDDLLSDLPLTMKGFEANPFLPPGSDLLARFTALFPPETVGGADPASWPQDRRQEALTVIRGMRTAVQARLEEVARPKETLSRAAEALRLTLGELREVSVLLQTGRERQAMETLVRFTDVVRALMDVLPFLSPEPERARLITEVTPVLRELVSAFDAHDAVLIGDLLEYEVAPRMERLMPLLEAST